VGIVIVMVNENTSRKVFNVGSITCCEKYIT